MRYGFALLIAIALLVGWFHFYVNPNHAHLREVRECAISLKSLTPQTHHQCQQKVLTQTQGVVPFFHIGEKK